MELIQKKYAGAQLTQSMLKMEGRVSHVGDSGNEFMVDLSVEGKKQYVDIGDLIMHV